MRRIQKIIQVTKPTAMIDMMPPKRSCASKLRSLEVKVSSAPNAERDRQRQATPSQIARSRSRRPVLHQVGDEDAHDERGLQALTQADQVVREHRGIPSW